MSTRNTQNAHPATLENRSAVCSKVKYTFPLRPCSPSCTVNLVPGCAGPGMPGQGIAFDPTERRDAPLCVPYSHRSCREANTLQIKDTLSKGCSLEVEPPPLAGGVGGLRHWTDEGPFQLPCCCLRGFFFQGDEGFSKPAALFPSSAPLWEGRAFLSGSKWPQLVLT